MNAPDGRGHEPLPAASEVPARGDEGELSATLRGLAAPDLVPKERRGLINQLARQLPRARLRRPGAALRWVTDTVSGIAPQIPVRDLAALQRQHRGPAGDLLADRLIRNAARATAGVGAASGGLAAVKWTVPPTLVAAPVLLCVETVAVVAIELKLVGELHEAYWSPVPGRGGQKAAALLQSWSQQRGLNPLLLSSTGLSTTLGVTARRELTERLARRFRGNLPTLAPLLAGAAVAGYLNQRTTRTLGNRLCSDLARQPAYGPGAAYGGAAYGPQRRR